MLQRLAALATGAGLTVVVLVAAGTDPFGRVLTSIRMPSAAVHLLETSQARGEALYLAGDYGHAMVEFEASGDDYNLGLSAARSGDYATALVAWERVLAKDPSDAQTKANHALVAGLLAGTQFDPVAGAEERKDGPEMRAEIGQGKARASSTGDGVNNKKAGFWMPEVTSEGLRRVPKIFDAQFVAANERWLATMEDQPGRYLRARLKAEQKARIVAGTALPVAEDPQ